MVFSFPRVKTAIWLISSERNYLYFHGGDILCFDPIQHQVGCLQQQTISSPLWIILRTLSRQNSPQNYATWFGILMYSTIVGIMDSSHCLKTKSLSTVLFAMSSAFEDSQGQQKIPVKRIQAPATGLSSFSAWISYVMLVWMHVNFEIRQSWFGSLITGKQVFQDVIFQQ